MSVKRDETVKRAETVLEVESRQVQEQLNEWIKNDRRRIKIFAELIMAIPLSRSVQGNDLVMALKSSVALIF